MEIRPHLKVYFLVDFKRLIPRKIEVKMFQIGHISTDISDNFDENLTVKMLIANKKINRNQRNISF